MGLGLHPRRSSDFALALTARRWHSLLHVMVGLICILHSLDLHFLLGIWDLVWLLGLGGVSWVGMGCMFDWLLGWLVGCLVPIPLLSFRNWMVDGWEGGWEGG